MNELFFLPRLDEDGYFKGMCAFMRDPATGDPLLPDDVAIAGAPCDDPVTADSFYKWDGEAWQAESKPKTCAECVAQGPISHQKQTSRCNLLRNLYQSLVEQDAEHFRITRGENLEWAVEVIPEKTEEEKAAEAKKVRISELKAKLAETDYVAAKIAEGAATKEEYASVLADRQAWRDEINQLEGNE